MANVRASTLYRLVTSSSNRPKVEACPGLWRDLDRFERRDDAWRIADRKDELAQQAPLVRFAELTVVTVGALRDVGVTLEPTGRNARHFTVMRHHADQGSGPGQQPFRGG